MERLRRAHANLECQVEQLTASLADAASKKADAEQRLRQYQLVRLHCPFWPHFCRASSAWCLLAGMAPARTCTHDVHHRTPLQRHSREGSIQLCMRMLSECPASGLPLP